MTELVIPIGRPLDALIMTATFCGYYTMSVSHGIIGHARRAAIGCPYNNRVLYGYYIIRKPGQIIDAALALS